MAAKKTASVKSTSLAPRKAPAKQAGSPKHRTAAGPRSAAKSAKTGDEVVTIDRRRDSQRSAKPEAAVPETAPTLERRKKVQRRRQIDPTTCERDYSIEEVAFMNAMDEYKRTSGRMFPTCSEVLEVIRSLGYVRLSPAGRAMFAEIEAPLGESAEQEMDEQELSLSESL